MASSKNRPVRDTNVRVYNRGRCALTVEPVTADDAEQSRTVNLEVARAIEGTATYDWDDKLVLQVMRRELPDVLAVVLGWIDTCEFEYHGPARNKGYRLRHDGLRMMLEVFSKTAGMRPVALARGDRAALAALLFYQYQRNHGGVTADVLFAMLKAIYAATKEHS